MRRQKQALAGGSCVQPHHLLAQLQPSSPSGRQVPWHRRGPGAGPATARSQGCASGCPPGWAPRSTGGGRSCRRHQTSITRLWSAAWGLLEPSTDPTTHLEQEIHHSLVYTTFSDLQLQTQLSETNHYLGITCSALYLYASASLSLSSLTLPQLPTHCGAALLTTAASKYRTAWHREQEWRRKRNRWRVEQHPPVLWQSNRWRKSEHSFKPFQHRAI